jgi:SpoVK/Ycf46/Vps4 family AAA+-type ATPase
MLPPEFARKGRFDEIFGIDLPNPEERAEIIRIHLSKRKRDPGQFDIGRLVEEMAGFTGSDIEQAIKVALKMAFSEKSPVTSEHCVRGARSIVPLVKTEAGRVQEIRDWCATRAKPANARAEILKSSTKPGRKIVVGRN